jgi:hypothetical protein
MKLLGVARQLHKVTDNWLCHELVWLEVEKEMSFGSQDQESRTLKKTQQLLKREN